jgi:hypothetical protein
MGAQDTHPSHPIRHNVGDYLLPGDRLQRKFVALIVNPFDNRTATDFYRFFICDLVP